MPQRKVGPATPRRAAAPRPLPRPFSIICPRGGSGRAWERSHRLLPTGVRSPRHRGAVIARVEGTSPKRGCCSAMLPPRGNGRASRGRCRHRAEPDTRDVWRGPGCARSPGAPCGGLGDLGTRPPRGCPEQGQGKATPCPSWCPRSRSPKAASLLAPEAPVCGESRLISRRPPAEHRRCHRSSELQFPLATLTEASGRCCPPGSGTGGAARG